MTQTCPTASELHGLIGGLFSDADAQSMELHIERCEACQHTIQELAADGTFWKLAVKNLSGDRIAGPGLDRVVEALQNQSREDAQEIGEAIELKLSFIEPPVEPGTIGRLRHYDILRVAGRGGMGIVLRAFDRSLRRIVAIKLLAPHLAGNGQARQRFVREGRAAAAVSHEHVVTIHAVEETPPFLVMQYVPGETLEERIHRTGSLDVREAVRIALQITQGLAAAHAQGVVHRDIKPANILLENGVARVRITDFGLARAIDDASLTQSGVVAGTPQYMAPEQASGDSIDERADLFSLGSVLYTMLAGHAPFRATTAMGVLRRLCDNPARPIREINPETPDWLVVLINRLHAKRPADRFHSATEVAGLLERGLAAMQTGAAMPSAFAPSETAMASGRAPAPREIAMSAGFSSDESLATQDVAAGRESLERHAAHVPQSSFIFTDLGAIAQRLVGLCPLWLLFACVGLAVAPFFRGAGILSGAFAMIALLAPRVFPRLTSKLLNGSAHARAESETATVNQVEATRGRSSILIGVLQQSAWSLLWTLLALAWVPRFYGFYKDDMVYATPHELSAATGKLLLVMAVSYVACLVIAFNWFRQKSNSGLPLFSPVICRKGMLTIAGLAAICAACVYSTWHSNVQRVRRQQFVDADRGMSFSSPPARQTYCRVLIEVEEPTKGIIVFIDNGSPDLAWATDGNSTEKVFPAINGTFPWRATLGNNTFAAGEVTLEAGRLAVIRVPRPKLMDLISGRWKSEARSGVAPTTNMEWEFHEGTAIAANRTPGSPSRSDVTFQIDDSVSPALITLVPGSGEKLEGIIRLIPRVYDPQQMEPPLDHSETDSPMAMMHRMMRSGESQHATDRDRLWICYSAPGRLRPWRFPSDAEQGVELFELIRSDEPKSLRSALALEPLPNEATAAVVRDSVMAWSKHLSIPIERRNSIGLELTLIPPTHVELPPDRVGRETRLLMPEGTKIFDDNSLPESDQLPIVSYPFVISRDVITVAQFQQFVAETGYVTDAERTAPPADRTPATETSLPAENAAAANNPSTPGTTGGWVREYDESAPPTAAGSDRPDGRFIWHGGLSWKTPTVAAAGHQGFPNLASPLPVVMLSDNDATAFCEWLSAKENRQYRLPTALEWTAALQLGVMHRPLEGEDPGEKRRWFDAGQPHPLGVRVSARIAGEWTSSTHRSQARQSIRPKKLTVIVKKDLSSDGSRFDLSHQLFASPTFRSSEISFRVVAELQALTTRDEDSPGLR